MDGTNKYISLEEEARSQTTSKERLRELAALNDDLAEIVAGNVSASPELLKELTKNENKIIRKAVTSNPNTPKETLLKLGKYFPQELLDNPIFDLLVLEDLKFLEDIPEHILNTLIQQPKVPNFLSNYAKNHQNADIRETANMQVILSGEITEQWHEIAEAKILKCSYINKFTLNFNGIISKYKNRWTRSYIETDNLPGESFNLLTNFYQFIQFDLFKSRMFKFFIVHNRNVEPTVLKQLAGDEELSIRGGIAGNPATPPEVLKLLASDSLVCRTVAGNRNTPIEILKTLAADRDPQIRYRVAGNPNTPPEILESLLNDYNNSVNENNSLIFEAVAKNPNTPPEILKSLAANSEKQVIKRESKNSNSLSLEERMEILRTASRNYHKRIIRNIAKNLSTPIEVLNSFTSNIESYVWEEVAGNPNASADILKYFAAVKYKSDGYNETFHCTIATNPNTPVEILEAYANSSNAQIRISVANNPNAPVKILKLLANSEDYKMRFRVGRNPNTPTNLLESLANDSNSCVRESVSQNPNAPLEILEKLANDRNLFVRESVVKNPQCTHHIKEIIFKNFAKSDTPSLSRIALFLSDYAESSVLAENSNSISWLERYAIACNRKTPEDVLKQLAQDGNRIVRATAKESLQKYY